MTVDGPVLLTNGNKEDPGLVRGVIAACEGRAGSTCIYDTGRLVFWTSHARTKTRPVHTPWRSHVLLQLQLPSGGGRSSEVPSAAFWGGDERYGMAPSTSRRVFGDAHRTREWPLDDGAGLLLSYVVVSENYAAEQETQISRYLVPSKPASACLNALIVEWVDEEEGTARRIGTAVFTEAEWMALDRDWGLVILE